MSHLRPHARPVRTALRRGNLSGSFVVGKYSFSPYMACEHGCVYCDGRAERYYVEGDFERDIVVRPNLPELLAREMPRLREKGFISIGSGISDAYQPLEAREQIMARCAGILAGHDHPVTLMTKSSLALRDLEAWSRVNERSRFVFLVSLTHATDETRSVWEPGASSAEARLEALRRFGEAGCATGVLAMPLLPGITDTDENIAGLYDRLQAIGVDFIMPGGLTLRPGRQKDFFMGHLRRHQPDLLPLYEELYREERASGAPLTAYTSALHSRLAAHHARVGLPWLLPHRVYRNHLHRYDEVNVLLHHMIELYAARGTATQPLRSALTRYLRWLEERKTAYNRHRSWRYEDLDAELEALCRGPSDDAAVDHDAPIDHATPIGDDSRNGGARAGVDPGEFPPLAGIMGNTKLARFVSRVVLDRACFDYVNLKLEDAS